MVIAVGERGAFIICSISERSLVSVFRLQVRQTDPVGEVLRMTWQTADLPAALPSGDVDGRWVRE